MSILEPARVKTDVPHTSPTCLTRKLYQRSGVLAVIPKDRSNFPKFRLSSLGRHLEAYELKCR